MSKASRVQLPSLSTSVKVVLRIKKEDKSDSKNTLIAEKRSDGKDHVMVNHDTQHAFPFDKALDQGATQLDTYNAVIGNGIDLCLSGYHVSVFAYGQTGSGKTYSITGIESQPGILPLFATNLFKRISKEKLESNIYVTLSFYEVYQEKVFDLLSVNRKALRVRGGTDDPYVENVMEIGVKNEVELEQWRRTGLSRRATAATLMNELSSRSHAIFCLKVQREYEGSGRVVVSKCFFVDLAGSERLPTPGHRFNESTSINKSLLSLQRVVEARASNNGYVSYRDSVLTRLLKNCFDGNSVTTLLATVSSLQRYATETLNTLRFASKAAQITQDPTINEEVDGETPAYLREQNDFFMRNIAEMGAQTETVKQHCASVEKIQAPAVLQLFQDESLNQWIPLENGTKFSLLEDRLAKYSLKDKKWNITALAAGVFINGVSLEKQSSEILKHGDVVSYYERKFCAIYLDEKCDPQKFVSYDRAKLEYVTKVFEKQKEEITEEIVAESKQNVKAVRDTLETELGTLRKELESLKEQLKKNKTDEEKSAVKKEVEMVESMIHDTEDVKKNLTAAVLKETEIFKAKKEDSEEEKTMHVMIKSKIEMMNSLLNRTGKIKIFDFRFHDLQTVKLFNKKNKVYAELDCEKFFEMYDQFADLYQSNRTPDEILDEFNCFLHSSRYVWKPLRFGVGSSLLQTAVFNTLHETARKRRSTYADVSYGFASRRSVIADIIQKPSERPTHQPIDEFIRNLSLFALSGERVLKTHEDLEKLSETSILLNTCAAIRKNFGVFVAPENFMTAASLQKKATNIVGVYRSIGSLDVLDALAQNCFISPSLVDIGLDYCPKEILERIDRLRQLIESWIIAVREDIVSTDQGKLLFSEIDRIIHVVGYLAYFLGKKVEIVDDDVQKEFMKGVMSAITELTADVPTILEQCKAEKTTREKMKKLAATFVKEVLKYAQEPANQEFVFEVCRRVIDIKEQVISLKDDRDGKMLGKLDDLILKMEEFPTIVKPETIETIKNGLLVWEQVIKSDDYCFTCENGCDEISGELVCCETCPKVYHNVCHIPMINGDVKYLPNDWRCTRCKNVQPITEPSEQFTEREKMVCARVLLACYEKVRGDPAQHSEPFHNPVPRSLKRYYDVITNPICFKDISKKISTLRYQNIQQFIDDMNLVFKNACAFNRKGTPIELSCRIVFDFYSHAVKELLRPYHSKIWLYQNSPKI